MRPLSFVLLSPQQLQPRDRAQPPITPPSDVYKRQQQGRGANPLRSEFIAGFSITEAEIADVVAFLESLTDERFLHNPAHGDPWPRPPMAHRLPELRSESHPASQRGP